MPRFIKTNHNPEGGVLRIESAVRGTDGKCYLVLYRTPPHYAKPPTFVVELSGERMDVRAFGDQAAAVFYKAYALQEFTPKELNYLMGLKEGGTHAPFLNFTYPNILKRMGKTVYRFTDAEVAQIVEPRMWKLIAGSV